VAASAQHLAFRLVEVPGHHDCLHGTAPAGLGKASAQQPRAGGLPSGGRHDHEVVDLARGAAWIVDRRRTGQRGDAEAGQLASLFADQSDDLVIFYKPGQVAAVLVQRAHGRPPEDRLVPRVLLAPDLCQGRHRGDVSPGGDANHSTRSVSRRRADTLTGAVEIAAIAAAELYGRYPPNP
jgi:hypothetical protein